MSESLAWAAGFFDGEGHTASQKPRDYPLIDVAQVDREPLDRLAAALGVGHVVGPYQRKHGQPYWAWRVHGFERVQHAVAQMWPWLSTPKREQARQVLLLARVRPARRLRTSTTPGICGRGHARPDGTRCSICRRDDKRAERARKVSV